MVRSYKIARCGVSFLFVLSLLSGCATHERLHTEDGKTPSILMKEASDDFDKGRYGDAIRKFEQIVKGHPDSELGDKAMLKMADAYYKSKEHYMAFTFYWTFEKRHPNHADLPYVIFQQGMCLFNKVNSFDKNQSLILDARGEFERLDQRYPGGEFAGKAQIKMRECDELLARYELHVGHFYFDKKQYRAAIGRYEYVMKNYPDLAPYHEALEYAKKSREILNLPEEQEAPEQRLPRREPPMITAQVTFSAEQSPPRKETVIASQKTEETKSERSVESALPSPAMNRPTPQNEENPEIPAPVKSIQTTPQKMAFSVQVGAFLVKKNAERLVADLTRKRYRPFILELSGYEKKCWHSVRILNCPDSKEAFQAASEYRAKEGRPAIVTAVDSLEPISPGR